MLESAKAKGSPLITGKISPSITFFVHARASVCVFVCACVRARARVCVFMCACVSLTSRVRAPGHLIAAAVLSPTVMQHSQRTSLHLRCKTTDAHYLAASVMKNHVVDPTILQVFYCFVFLLCLLVAF